MQGLFAYFAGFGVWNWFILGVVLFVLEFMLPGVHFLWFGLAAVVVGVLALTTGVTWPFQVIAFGVIAVLTVFGVRRYVRSGRDQAATSPTSTSAASSTSAARWWWSRRSRTAAARCASATRCGRPRGLTRRRERA